MRHVSHHHKSGVGMKTERFFIAYAIIPILWGVGCDEFRISEYWLAH